MSALDLPGHADAVLCSAGKDDLPGRLCSPARQDIRTRAVWHGQTGPSGSPAASPEACPGFE